MLADVTILPSPDAQLPAGGLNFPTVSEETVPLMTFRIGSRRIGIPVHLGRELLVWPDITSVPRGPEWLLGAASVRGDLVTMIDLQSLLDLQTTQRKPDSQILIIDFQGWVFGVPVEFATILNIAPNTMDSHPESNIRPVFLSLITVTEEPVHMISVEALKKHVEFTLNFPS